MRFRGYRQFCPVAKAAEVVAERWTPLIVRELLSGSHRFNELRRGVPLISPALLAGRLRQLEDAGVVERRRSSDGRHWDYSLTPAGEELRGVIEGLGAWGQRWARTPEHEVDLDVSLLMWDMRRRVQVDRLPRQRVVVEFDFSGTTPAKSRWWLVLEPEVQLCLVPPGGEVDLLVATDVETMTRIWMGDVTLAAALRAGDVVLRGPAQVRHAFSGWLGLSPFAGVRRPRPGGGRHGRAAG